MCLLVSAPGSCGSFAEGALLLYRELAIVSATALDLILPDQLHMHIEFCRCVCQNPIMQRRQTLQLLLASIFTHASTVLLELWILHNGRTLKGSLHLIWEESATSML